MKQKTLLLLVMSSLIISVNAQKKQKNDPSTGYVITAMEKGGRNWKEVKLVNVNTGEELKSIYQSTQEAEALNARTQKPVVKKNTTSETAKTTIYTYNTVEPAKLPVQVQASAKKKVVNLDDELNKVNGNNNVNVIVRNNGNSNVNTNVNTNIRRTVTVIAHPIQPDKPFSTNSAAMAYDRKHDRLYYTPMNIAQLRYIDLKSGKIYYFEDEQFGFVKGYGDVNNQITRMVIASDGEGYALTNDANHLIRFTTGKNPTITDLGALTDDNTSERSVHHQGGFGGDMIADASGNIYLVTANRNVFRFPIETRVASYVGTIKGLPRGFSTNGAMVEEGSKIIVASSESTDGYYRFDLNTMEAEKVSSSTAVFNASDLANGNLAFEKTKKKKKEEQPPVVEEVKDPVADLAARKTLSPDQLNGGSISVYPNPVIANGSIKVSFADQPVGKYQVQLLDISGKLISSKEVNIMNKSQVTDFSIPEVAKGNYLLKVVSEPNKVSVTNKVVVQ